ncbi:hypothetical protein G6F46_002936 [Rhizopus delemar]|nr:hypothetical protein G6F43_009256 [Rhizopus delemar]KAG1549474.1 hypothetical protein G6F51_003037 [Rhizopus arrhizus]KAG1454770.1 hypothetical protein G6F55_007430 [Rhizopus delemar]KAG1502359.1 hypothetical protein G6F54_002412 [Rhizopus delemar]KAG1516034.1 hypothetical protein G6F53_002470 [Rhizopus delemar]
MGYLNKVASNVYFIGGFAAIAGIMFGFDIGSNSGVIGTQQYKDYFHDPDSLLQGGINSALSAGCFVGALLAGFPSDRFSRKYTLIGASALFIIGSIFQAAANGVPMLCVGRVLNGLSVGVTSMVVPLYQSEIAPKEIRGRLVSVQQWSIVWGIFLAFWIQYGCQFIQSTAAFRIPWAVQAVPAVIIVCGMWFFPFSPRWLADRGRMEEALRVLADIHGNGDPNHPRVKLEMDEIEATIHFEKSIASHRYADLLKPGMAYRVSLGVCLQIWQQLTGMNIIMFYAVLLFEQAGVGDSQEATMLSSGISYVVTVVMTVPAILFVDRWGRRPTLIFGALAMSIFLWAVGGILATQEWYIDAADGKWKVHIDSTAKINGVMACIYLFVASFATTWGPLGWIYPAEIYPLRVRAMAVSLSTASNWLFNWLLNFVVPILMQRIQYGLYLLFAAFNTLMCIHVFIAYPETNGYTLEEIDIVFQHNPRKSIPREVLDQWMAEKAGQTDNHLGPVSSANSEKKVEISHV